MPYTEGSRLIFRRRSPGWSYWDWLKHLGVSWNWRMVEDNHVQIGRYVLEVTPYYMELLWREWRGWEKWDFPPLSLDGEKGLEVGAGCGENAPFYYYYGAGGGVAVEPAAFLG